MNRSILFFAILAFSVFSCSNDKKANLVMAAQEMQIDHQPGECPYLTKDNKGNAVLSWVRTMDGKKTAFCFAVSKDGKQFSDPVVVPNSGNIEPHGENLPKIIFKPSGEIIALWGAANPNPKNKYSGLVFYVQSFDGGKTWNQPRSLVADTASFDQRYYDVALLSNGEAGILWLDNRKTNHKEGSGLYFASTEGPEGFKNERMISQSCCQCCRTDLFVDTKGGIHATYRSIINDSIRDMVHIVSVDGGKTFSVPQRISNDNWVINGCPHTGPAMTENKNGIHFAWFTGGKNGGCFYTRSSDNGKNFTSRDSVCSSGSHPQLSSLSNGELVIVWDQSVVIENKLYKKIGIQRRDANGKNEGESFMTSGEANASYPVITSVDAGSSLVAYTKTEGSKSFIAYKFIDVASLPSGR